MADEAGAIYRIDGTVLINREIFDEYLEQFHQNNFFPVSVKQVIDFFGEQVNIDDHNIV